MSETDSENDYESADEVDQHLFETKSCVLENKVSGIHEEELSGGDSKLPPVENLNVEDKEINNKNVNEKKKHEEAKDYGNNSDVSKGGSAVKENSEAFAASYDNRVKTISRDSCEDSERKSSSDMQHKRVTLRLEKKLQQKNQAVTNSNIVVNEEPKQEEKISTWGFGSWGSSLLSTAAASVSTFTSQVSQGIGTVLETVETSLGAPPPEDLASLLKERREASLDADENEETSIPKETNQENSKEVETEEGIPSTSSLFTGVTSLTKVIESTGSKVLLGGLDTLELIGKKTYDIITEGDPGLRKKRSAFSKGVNLSQLLREAREKAEEGQVNTCLENEEDAVHFSTFFDEFQGLVHLEALEMLSSQCQSKVQGALMMVSGDSDVKENLEHVKRICEDLPSADETSDDKSQNFEENLRVHLKDLQLQIDMQKVQTVRNNIHEWLDQCIVEQKVDQFKDSKELYRQAIRSLAEFTARCVEQFHKFGELILVHSDPDFSALLCATHLTGLTSVLCVEVGIIANKYCQCLNTVADTSEDPNAVTPLITTVFLEASNSTTYIQDAFQLLVPVLQTSLLE